MSKIINKEIKETYLKLLVILERSTEKMIMFQDILMAKDDYPEYEEKMNNTLEKILSLFEKIEGHGYTSYTISSIKEHLKLLYKQHLANPTDNTLVYKQAYTVYALLSTGLGYDLIQKGILE